MKLNLKEEHWRISIKDLNLILNPRDFMSLGLNPITILFNWDDGLIRISDIDQFEWALTP